AVIIGFLAAAFVGTLPFVKRPLAEIPGLLAAGKNVLRRHPVLSIMLAIMLLGYLLLGLLPPVDFDSLMYHLATVKLYLQKGGFWNIFFNAQSDFPMLTEMNYMVGLAFGNDIICKTIALLIGFMFMAALAFAGKRYLGYGAKETIIGALIFCTATDIMVSIPSCEVDIAQALWTLLAILTLECYLERREKGLLLICGAFAGMAVQSKIFGVFVVPVLFARLLVADRQSFTFSPKRFMPYCTVLLCSLAAGLPWYIKSFQYKGSILSLTHSTLLDLPTVAPMNIAVHSPLAHSLVNIGLRIAAAPWTFSLFPGLHRHDTFGPLFIAILPFLLITGIPKKSRFLLLSAGVYWALTITMEILFVQDGASVRYSTLVLALGIVFMPWVLFRVSARPLLHKTLMLMTIGMIALGMVLFLKRNHNEWKALARLESRDAYYARVVPEYPVVKQLNGIADGSVIMPIYNYGNYLINVPYITTYRRYGSGAEMLGDLKEKHIGYIFANDVLDTSDNAKVFPEIPTKCIGQKNGYYLYKVIFAD
ncbi:MAG: glycosyltransferase family 39 protein, partial [Chitinivibrionales bacterium]|nr:glycosyltransferase family 39 protein [Chitinivibrionales bacterium]